jgi:RNA polymerase sigma factor (sigma-70 family)
MQVLADEDVKLAHRARRDAEAADRLLFRLRPRVWQVVRMVRSARQEAEELCQMCLIEILENLHKYRGEGSLESWAGQVAYRVSMRHVKTIRRREVREAPMPEGIGTSNANPEIEASRAAVWRRLLSELDGANPARRVSLLLHLAEGYTVEEVAEITGVSTNTTKDRLRTAYAELRAVFARNASLKQDILEIIHD